MRPVDKKALTRPDSLLVLMQALGPYCSFCERPLTEEFWLWHKSGTILPASHIRSRDIVKDWENWYLLDVDCMQSHVQRVNYYCDRLVGQILLPDDPALSFRLGKDSPIQYHLEKVDRIVIDDDGKQNRQSTEAVIATGTSDQAIRTIEHFAINTRYFNPKERTFVISKDDESMALDRRVGQRTEVWELAREVSKILAKPPDRSFLDAMTHGARLAIASAGFWSTWATVLGDHYSAEPKLLTQLLMPPKELELMFGPGPHNTFPGTKNGWQK